jgi:uncharacterized protein YkwD
MRAAQAHAEDMARTGVISHTGSDGRDLSRRLRDRKSILRHSANHELGISCSCLA